MRLSSYTVAVTITTAALFFMSGCGYRSASSPKSVTTARPQVKVDRDFEVRIGLTKDPRVFIVKIDKVNAKVDKTISGRAPVTVDFLLINDAGKVISRNEPYPSYAEDLGDISSAIRPGTTSLRGRFRLLARNMPPGTYWVVPHVIIAEDGKDQVWGWHPQPVADMGEVPIAAANRMRIVIK